VVAGLVAAVVAAAVVSPAAVVVSTAAAVVSTAAAEDQGQPHVGSLLGSGKDDGSLQTNSIFWQHLAIIWRPF
jgi:Spy/CpxP family protein refolding chaperone